MIQDPVLSATLQQAEKKTLEAQRLLGSWDIQAAKPLFLDVFSIVERLLKERDKNKATPKYENFRRQEKKVHKILYLPVEVKAREWKSKCWLAERALEDGFTVVIGATWVLNKWAEKGLPPGVVLFKTLWGTDAQNMTVWQKHLIAALDEEAFGIDYSHPFAKNLVGHPLAVARCDLICAFGEEYGRMVRTVYPNANVKVTGNPRAVTTESSAGEDILICLPSATVNGKHRDFATAIMKTLILYGFPLSSAQGQAWAAYQRQGIVRDLDLMIPIKSVVLALSAMFKDRRIVVRPHPAEDDSLWTRAFEALANVEIAGEGAITKVLREARVMVYVGGCTTGLDAFLAGLPSVRLELDWCGISNRIHTGARTAEQISKTVSDIVEGDPLRGSLENYYKKDSTLIEELSVLWEHNSLEGIPDFGAVPEYNPSIIDESKFPVVELDELHFGNARQVAWNTFIVQPK